MNRISIDRRRFLTSTGIASAALIMGVRPVRARQISPNEKLNIGVIGVAGQGAWNLERLASENIVALCDVDEERRIAAAQKFPGAKLYTDFRKLIDQKDIDAILIATPDHTHAVAAVRALKSGRHLYCEKPLAHTVSEARIITETARKEKRATQLGTQVHAGQNYRRVVELIQAGAIGVVKEVHVWVNSSWGGRQKSPERPPVPPHLHYDFWLGPVPFQPYHPEHVHYHWRSWWAFGGGSLADFGCHFMDLPHWALNLREPLSAEAEGPPVDPMSPPPWLIVRYEYPARGASPPVKLTWYHGGKRPEFLDPVLAKKWPGGILFMGEKDKMLLADYNRYVLLPEKEFEGYVRPQPTIPDSVGHHKEWIDACKTGSATSCSFDYSGPLTEAALLGNVAFRAGEKIQWDARKLKAISCRAADEFIQHHYRRGWRI
ncbi:MAG: Gfo/Idh/MocA family oxidoreductase [Verrucomicrobia subdivision 3 bacterium]|nr:Gfo/Idh/MocA family oxidoreductase [Limisphaerales bacterium]